MEVEKIEEVIAMIREERYLYVEDVFEQLGEYLSPVIAVYTALIQELPELKQKGIDLPEDVILQQVKNLNEAVERRDFIRFYDTLRYEAINAIELYKEIRMEAK